MRLRMEPLGLLLWGAHPHPDGAEYMGTLTMEDGEQGALWKLPVGQEWVVDGEGVGRYALGAGGTLRPLSTVAVDATLMRSAVAASLGAAGGRAARGDKKRRGDGDYYRRLRQNRA